MAVREIRVSPDGNIVAIRTDSPIGDWNAWGSIDAKQGGQWLTDAAVQDWFQIQAPSSNS